MMCNVMAYLLLNFELSYFSPFSRRLLLDDRNQDAGDKHHT